jgi:PAS domain S-box-containing protein
MSDEDGSEEEDVDLEGEQLRRRRFQQDGGEAVDEDELRRLLDLSTDLFAIAGFDGRFRVLSAAWETTLGLPREELRAKPFMDFVHPDDREKTTAVLERILDGARLFSFQNRYRCKDGSYRPLTWQAVIEPGKQRIYCVACDATERLRRQERENVLDAVCEQSREAIVMQSKDGRVTAWTGAAEQLFGHLSSEIVGKPLAELLSREDGMPADLLGLLAAAPALDRIPATFERRGGERVRVLVAVSAVGDGATQITGAVATMSPA